MKKIFIILIIVLVALATLVGGWLIYKKGDFSFASSGIIRENSSEIQENPYAKFTLSPDRWYCKVGETVFVDVIVDTNEKKVKELTTAIKYDPEVLQVVGGKGEYADSVFDWVTKKVDAKKGIVTIKAEMKDGSYYATTKGGHYDYGQIVRIYFKKKKNVAETRISGLHNQTHNRLAEEEIKEMDQGGGKPPVDSQYAFQNDFYTIIYGK